MGLSQLISGLFSGGGDDTDESQTAPSQEDCEHTFPDWPDEHPYAWRLHLTTPVENPDDDVQLLATRERGCRKCGKRQREFATLADLDVSLNENGSINSLDFTTIDEQHQ